LAFCHYTQGMRKLLAEGLATFALVFAGAGAIVVDDVSGGAVSHVGVSLTFGLVVMAMIHAVGDVSGAHMNPAVTIGFYVSRRFPGSQVAPYVASQVAGAVAASLLLRALFPAHEMLGATLPAGPPVQSLALEYVTTAMLMFVILGVATGAKEQGITAGIVVGGAVALGALFAGPVSGGSMNPARSIGPALVSGHLSALWLYVAAPIGGAVSAVVACRYVRGRDCCSAEAGY